MKTEQDYIREAAELLGYEITDTNDDGVFFDFPLEHKNGQIYMRNVHCSWQWVKDALAAQLARQVRTVAIQRRQPWLWTNLRRAVMGESLNDDLTMNTIKAIVDSGVLKDE